MEGWNADRVLRLAPDAASAKAGQGLADGRHWVSSGRSDSFVWGECKGSGAKPYQVRVDLTEPAFKCSCPSRKFPCKHALGLLLLTAGGATPEAETPPWVAEWAAERAARTEKKLEKAAAPPKPVDAVAQQKRAESRLAKVADGLAALKLWLNDLARGGIATAPSRGYAFFDEQARRMVDAQAPGVARRLRTLATVPARGAGWERAFLDQLASLHLLINGFERRDALPASARDAVLNTVGIARPAEDVLALPAVADRWQVIAQDITAEDNLRAQTTWLLGTQSGVATTVLAFAHGSQPLDASLQPGFAFDGELCLFPGDGTRAVVKQKGDSVPLTAIERGGDLDALLDRYATARSLNPWLEGIAFPLSAVTPSRDGDDWRVQDAAGRILPLAANDADGWQLLAVSGGSPLTLVVHYDGARVRPMAALHQGEYLAFGRTEEVGA